MFRMILSFFGFAALLSTSVGANTIQIESGDHANFTRLVVPIPSRDTPWTLSKVGNLRLLAIDDTSVEFDIEGAFDKISRNRVSQIRKNPGGFLEIELGCDCSISSYLWRSKYLVLDIHSPDGESNKQPVKLKSEVTPSWQLGFGEKFPERAQIGTTQEYATGENLILEETPLAANITFATPSPSGSNSTHNLPEHPNLQSEKSSLVGGILEATAKGLLQPAELNGTDSYEQPEGTIDFYINPASNLRNLNVSNAFEKGFDSSTLSTKSYHTDSCIPDEDLNISNWADGRSLVDLASELRGNLIDESLALDSEIAMRLARAYVHFGMGAEAQAVLNQISSDFPGHEIVSALAEIVDFPEEVKKTRFEGQHHCPTSAALWAVLIAPADEQLTEVNTNALLFAFQDLPFNLRKHLGPKLSQILVAQNYIKTAEKILTKLHNFSPNDQSETEYITGRIAEARGDVDEATQHYETAFNVNNEDAPRALIEAIRHKFDSHSPISNDTASTASAFSIEYRELPLGMKLREAHFLARLANVDFGTAFEVLDEIKNLDGQNEHSKHLQTFAEYTASKANDSDFLKIAINDLSVTTTQLNSEVSNKLANRLLQLGLAESAQVFAAPGADGVIGRERRILRAKIALALNDTDAAQAHLLGIDGPDVTKLMAQAKKLTGDLKSAEALMRVANFDDVAESMAWRNGNWDALRNAKRNSQKAAAELMLEQPSDLPLSEETPSLEMSSQFIKDSAAARSTLSELLSEHQIESAMAENVSGGS